MNKRAKIFSVILVIIMILSLLLCVRPVADKVGEIAKVSGDVIIYWARTVFGIALGAWLIYTGVAALAVPAVGIALIVIGLVLIGYSVYPLFTKNSSTSNG